MDTTGSDLNIGDDILIVDDTKANLQLLSDILNNTGYKVRPDSNGEKALRSVKAKLPDLILLDIKMPGMDGLEVCRKLKADEKTCSIPVIFFGVLEDERSKIQGFQAGAVDYISKPFYPEEVLARVKTHLSIKRLQLKLENQNARLLKEITERKQAEEALRKERERTQQYLDVAGVMLVFIDAEQNVAMINKKGCEILGYAEHEVLGKNWFDHFIKAENVEEIKEVFNHIISGNIESLEYFENPVSIKGGDERIIAWHNSIIRDGSGHIIGTLSSGEDITYRKLAEEEKDRILNLSCDLICIAGMDGYFKYVNPAWEKTLGYTREELLQRPFLDFIYPDDHSRNDAEVEKLGKGEQTTGFENRYLHKDGSILTISWTATPFEQEKNMYCIGRDITERKIAEEALIGEKLRSENYINSLPGLFYVFDEQRFVRWNSIWNRITGYSDEELASMYGTDFFEGKDKMLIEEQMLRAFREGTAEAEAELVTKRGERIPYYFNGLRKNLNGKDHLIGLGIDITDLKRAEEEKRKALEFAAEQSKHALIGQVAGKMAHDFNNVLMGIMGNAQLAIMNCDDEKTKEKLERINEFSERGRDITSNLLSFSKDQEPKQTYFKIEDKIELVLKMLEKDLAGIQVSRNYKPGIPRLLADLGMIQDVLVNLVQNSIHAMSKVGNPALNLKAYSQDDKVYFEIKDNGCGIPKEHLDSIYTPSFTLKGGNDRTGSYKSGIKGTGYGMSNVKKYIVEKHKGDIFLKSEVGKGTQITITLKIIKDHLSSDEKKEVMKSQLYDKRRILLVEDEPAIADIQYQVLTKEPFSHIVSIAVNGQMAIDIFDRNEFDVVSLDYMLPGRINGLDVYNHIRENAKDVPVIFISGNIEFLESMPKLREKDPNLNHLSKPVDNLDFVNKINELIGKSI